MKRRYWTVIVVLGALISSATVGWATTVYWRGNRYQLPGVYQSRVLDAILTDHKRDINALLAANQALTARVAALEARMATAETNIATNTQDIATNEADIATNAADIAANEADIAANAADIATNAADIAANETDIATNAADIAANEADIATNAADIAANEADIAGNTTAIVSHVANTSTAHSYDARYVRDSGENLRVIRGYVLSDGSIGTGSGFTVTKGGTGVYTINFDSPFTSIGAPVISGLTRAVANGGTFGSTSFTFNLSDSTDGSFVDRSFTFVVTGRQ